MDTKYFAVALLEWSQENHYTKGVGDLRPSQLSAILLLAQQLKDADHARTEAITR
jgi:hypothetical protein